MTALHSSATQIVNFLTVQRYILCIYLANFLPIFFNKRYRFFNPLSAANKYAITSKLEMSEEILCVMVAQEIESLVSLRSLVMRWSLNSLNSLNSLLLFSSERFSLD